MREHRKSWDWMVPPPLPMQEKPDLHKAALAVADHATDVDDLRDLLHVLGLDEALQ